MSIKNAHHGTRIDEVARDLYRISTPIEAFGGFSFNQYLLLDEAPLLFHTGPRAFFDGTCDAIASVMPLKNLKYLAYSHYESDECGAMDTFLTRCPQAVPVAGRIGAMLQSSSFNKPVQGMAEGEVLVTGQHKLRWLDTPHLPHGWDCGYLFDESTDVLFCGDLFTQPGAKNPALTTGDILGPSEKMRAPMDYYAHGPNTHACLERLAALSPKLLACMHGSAWEGHGASLLHELSGRLKAIA